MDLRLQRNGLDALNKTLLWSGVTVWVISRFVTVSAARGLLFYLFLLLEGICIYRYLSRNLERRQLENEKFKNILGPLHNRREIWQTRMQQRKQYKVFKCPSCNVKLRVPRGEGKVRVTCRQCGAIFEKKS